jgi:hypothetical protein
MMDRHSLPAIALYCHTCSLIRVAQDYAGAHARATAHTHLSGHDDLEYSVLDAPERLRLARAFEQRSQKTIHGYVLDGIADALQSLAEEDLIETALSEFTARR